MKTILLKPILAIAGASLLATGCVVRERTVYRGGPGVVETTEVEVPGDPPPPVEVDTVVGVAPGPDFVWIGGYYGWVGSRWEWHRGYWGRRPYRGAVWIGPRVVVRGGHRVWVGGRWR